MYDYDIISSSNHPVLLKCAFKGFPPITGSPLKGQKKVFTDEDRYEANLLTFGSKIGRLTNLASSMCCLRADFEEGSKEYKLLTQRLKSCCLYQNRQIDKHKCRFVVRATSNNVVNREISGVY